MGAELVRMEYGGWYGIGAYTIAVGVGFMRMYNGRHWQHDVVAGAGVGILSARVGEWSCRLWQKIFQTNGKKENDLVFTPVAIPVNGGYYGVFLLSHCIIVRTGLWHGLDIKSTMPSVFQSDVILVSFLSQVDVNRCPSCPSHCHFSLLVPHLLTTPHHLCREKVLLPSLQNCRNRLEALPGCGAGK